MATQLAAAAVLGVADVAIGVALLPMLGLLLVAVARLWRAGQSAPAVLPVPSRESTVRAS